MNILPAIDLRGGKVVQLVGGDPDHVGVQGELSPAGQAEVWRKAGAKMLHVVDLDAAFGQHNQWVHANRIRSVGLPVQFGGGVRSMTQIQQLLALGMDRIIIGTQGIKHQDWLQEVVTLFPGQIVLAVDARGQDVVINGWAKDAELNVVDLVRDLDGLGLAGFLYTNVEKEGRMQGIDEEVVKLLKAAATNTPLIVSGGISTMDDLQTLASLGVDSVVLGMSIYTGSLDLQAAIKKFGGAP